MHTSLKGTDLTHKQLILFLKDPFGEGLLVLSSPSVATLVVFWNEAKGILMLVQADDDDDIALSFKSRKKILHETELLNQEKNHLSNKVTCAMMRLRYCPVKHMLLCCTNQQL